MSRFEEAVLKVLGNLSAKTDTPSLHFEGAR
jgi:hypothetical protein